MTVRNATFEDMPLIARIMVTSFRTAFSEFVSRETMDACADPKNCRAMMQHAYRQGKMRFVLGEDQGFICWAEGETGAEIIAVHSLPE